MPPNCLKYISLQSLQINLEKNVILWWLALVRNFFEEIFGSFFPLKKKKELACSTKASFLRTEKLWLTVLWERALYPISDFLANVVEMYNSQKAARQSGSCSGYLWPPPCESARKWQAASRQQASSWASFSCLAVQQDQLPKSWTWLGKPRASGGRCGWQSW